MGEGWNGDPVEIVSGTPKDVTQLRKNLIQTFNEGAKYGVDQFPGQMAAQASPMSNMAADMIARMSGYGGYNPTSLQPQGGGGGGATTPVFQGSRGGTPTPLPIGEGTTPMPEPRPAPGPNPGPGIRPTPDMRGSRQLQMMAQLLGGRYQQGNPESDPSAVPTMEEYLAARRTAPR